MFKLKGSVRTDRDHDFEGEIADRYRELGDTVVCERVKKINGHTIADSNGNELGDIDVLVVGRRQKVVLVIEAKNFETARTPIEMSRDMNKLKGKAVPKSHRRADWIREHLQEVVEESNVPQWSVRELIVTSRASTAVATGNGVPNAVSKSDLRSSSSMRVLLG